MSENYDEMYLAIGKALSHWASVERSLCELIQRVVGTPAFLPISAAFYTVKSFSTRLEMTENAILARAGRGSPLWTEWSKVVGPLKDSSKRRNACAHCAVMTRAFGTPQEELVLVDEWLNVARIDRADMKKFKDKQEEKTLTFAEVKTLPDEFDRLTAAVQVVTSFVR